MEKIIYEKFDVVVIGGGPAGLMAAGTAADDGARVALIEKNDRYGIKLLMTGNGRCNVTQAESDLLKLAKNYGRHGKFLLSAFNEFSPENLREFLRTRGVETKEEKNGRVFPVSDMGKDVLDALYQYLRANGVTFFNEEEVIDIECENDKIKKVITKKKEITSKNYILATGGKSYPSTGSNGKGYEWARKMGHTIIEPKPSLVPIKVKEQWISQGQGVSAHTVELTVIQKNKKIAKATGDIMFAHFGLSGPLALNISRDIQRIIEKGEVKLNLDLKPHLNFEQVDDIIIKDFEKNHNKNLSNCLNDFLSPKLRDFIFALSGLELTKHASKISKKERHQIVSLIKNLEMTVEELFGFERAMVTSGGISTKEIDSKTMRSKLMENLYFAGEIIDVDGPTGGYNLQLCWSTGYVAGKNAAKCKED